MHRIAALMFAFVAAGCGGNKDQTSGMSPSSDIQMSSSALAELQCSFVANGQDYNIENVSSISYPNDNGEPLNVTKIPDSLSPTLIDFAFRGQNIDSVTYGMYYQGVPYLQTRYNSLIIDVRYNGQTHEEQVTFQF